MAAGDAVQGRPSSPPDRQSPRQPLLRRQKTETEKLQRGLSAHAFAIADATKTGIEHKELFGSWLGQLWLKWLGRTDVMSIVLPIFVEPAFKSRSRRWAFVYIITMVLSSLLQVQITHVNLCVTSSLEWMDAESFYYWLFMWFIVQSASLLKGAVRAQARWELRVMVQWRLQFRMGHALFTDDALHHLQVGMLKADMSQDMPHPAPESLLCRDSYMWLHEFTLALDNLFNVMIMLVTSIYTVSRWSYAATAYMLLTVPLRAALTWWMMPRALFFVHRFILATNWDLMFIMGRIQDNSEQIALLRGGQAELGRFASALRVLLRNHLTFLLWSHIQQLCVMLLGTAFIFPVLVRLLYDVCDYGLPVSAALTYHHQCNMVQMHLSTLSGSQALFLRYQQTVENMNKLIEEGIRIQKHTELRRKLAEERCQGTETGCILVHPRGLLEEEGGPALELRDVTLWAPKLGGGHGIILGFHLKLMRNQSLLIVGDTGVGKSALLKAMHGLWWCGCGHVDRCHNSLLSYMPERPFAFAGSLRQNLLYPEVEDSDDITNEEIMSTLEALNLQSIVRSVGLDSQVPWHSVLSLGQQQRLGFARILLRPSIRLVLLDEATSALDMKNERRIYGFLRDRFPCYVSVGHRPSIKEYHTHVAVLSFKSDRSIATSEASFMPMGDFDFENVKQMNHKNTRSETAEEKIWAQKSLLSMADVSEAEATLTSPNFTETPKGAAQEDEEVDMSRSPVLISLERRWGGVGLVVRTVRDIIWPMLSQPEVVLPIAFLFGASYTFSYINLAMDSWFGWPYTQVIQVMQTRSSKLCWEFFFRVICLYYPVSLLFILMSRVFIMLQVIVTRVLIKWYLAKCYLDPKTDTYYHMSVSRIIEGNPGTRISNWDADEANFFITSLVSTFSTAVFGVWISSRSLYQMDKVAFSFFIVYIIAGAGLYTAAGLQVFRAYIGWLDLTMKLHHKVLHLREHSETVALLQGSDCERRLAFQAMDQAITPGQKYLWRKDAALFMGSLYFEELSDTILTTLTGPMVLTGTSNFFMFNQLKGIIGAGSHGVQAMMTELILNVTGQAAMERVWELLAVILHIRGAERGKNRFGGDLVMEEDPKMPHVLELRSVNLCTPVSSCGVGKCAMLVKDVSLTVPFGDSLLIAGESGIGKSSVLRAVAGLWRHGDGTIRMLDEQKTFFIPQRPYVFFGTLRENLLYPHTQRMDIDDDTVKSVAERVGLAHLAVSPGLGSNRRSIEELADVNAEPDRGWFWRLSLGELQRLNFGRLLLKENIHLAFLDEATSALSINIEEEMYRTLKETVGSYISVAHRPQLRRFHERAFVMLTDHSKNATAGCKTVCRLMSMQEYERELDVKVDN